MPSAQEFVAEHWFELAAQFGFGVFVLPVVVATVEVVVVVVTGEAVVPGVGALVGEVVSGGVGEGATPQSPAILISTSAQFQN